MVNSIVDLFGDRVLLKPDAPESVTAFGFEIADPKRSSEYPLQATVVDLPPEDKAMPGFQDPSKFLKIGDRVLFNPYAGDEIKQGVDEYRVVMLDDIYGLIISSTPNATSNQAVA